MNKSPLSLIALFIVLGLAMQFSGCHPFDKSQVPDISLEESLTPKISWTPEGAWRIRVFEGGEDLDTYGEALMWDLTGFSAKNSIVSPVTYGVVPDGGSEQKPAKALSAGQEYTVVVIRMDPKAEGSGFTRRSNDYRAVLSFVP